MTDIRFDLIMTGHLATGVSRDSAISKLAALFKRQPEQVENLLSGKASRVRKNLTQAELQRYQAVFNTIGVVTKALPASKVTTTVEHNTAHPNTLSLCPSGTPVLNMDERQGPAAIAPDTHHLSVAKAGQPLNNEYSVPPPSPPETDHISLAPVGADFLSSPATENISGPQVDHLRLCDPGTPLLDEKPERSYHPPNTDHLKQQ